MSWRKYLFSFSGRINRARMWLFYVVVWAMEFALFLGILLTYAILVATGQVDRNTFPETHSSGPGIGLVIVAAIFIIAVDYMYLAVTVKRLHDRNRSAWWLLVFFLGPVLLIFVPEILIATRAVAYHPRMQIAFVAPGLAGMALYIWAFVELYFLRGTVGDNRFGPDPLAGRP